MLIHDLKKRGGDTNLLPMSQFLTPSNFEDIEYHTSPSQDFLPYSLRGKLLVSWSFML